MNPSTAISNSPLIATKDNYDTVIKRAGLDNIAQYRLKPELAAKYTINQLNAWARRKETNQEAHSALPAGTATVEETFLQKYPPANQASVARLAEFRMAATAVVFSESGIQALIDFGNQIKDTDLDTLKSQLAAAPAGQPYVIPQLESFMTEKTGIASPEGRSYTEILRKIHHATWHTNLDAAHDFAYSEDRLPSDTNKTISGKEFPDNLRDHSYKADTLNVLGQLSALAQTFKDASPITNMVSPRLQPKDQTNSALNLNWNSKLVALENSAIVNN